MRLKVPKIFFVVVKLSFIKFNSKYYVSYTYTTYYNYTYIYIIIFNKYSAEFTCTWTKPLLSLFIFSYISTNNNNCVFQSS